MRKNGAGTLLITLFVGVLIGSAIGQLLGVFISDEHIVSKALIDPLVDYGVGPWDFNLIIILFTLGFRIYINFFGILGLVAAWYYHKYSY